MDVAQAILQITMEIPDAASILVDHQGIICAVNETYKKIVKLSEKELIGKCIYDFPWETKSLQVIKTGRPVIGYNWMVKGKLEGVASSYPVKKGPRVEGCFTYTIFLNNSGIHSMMENMFSELNMYKEEFSRAYSTSYGMDDIIGQSPDVKQIKRLVSKIANLAETPVLIEGESGTGKELFANAIHNCSNRSDKPFVRINCAAIPDNLIESELFGYEVGAFTDAKKTGKVGKFELANQGTIFLDEIGEMPLFMQSKVLVALQEKTIERIGAIKPIRLNVRVIAATNRNLESMVSEGAFREDLYYRLNVINLNIPPLRSRKADIPLLAHYLLSKLTLKLKSLVKSISPEAMALLQSYNWPGNVRELENALERAIILADMGHEHIIQARHLHSISHEILFQQIPMEGTLKELLGNFEAEVIRSVLEQTGHHKEETARLLQIDKSQLYRKLKKLNSHSGDVC